MRKQRRTTPKRSKRLRELEDDYHVWLTTLFPNIFSGEFAPHHDWLWEWVWAMADERPDPLVAIWPRGGAKSTSTEGAVVAAGALRKRNYALYLCDTQERADDHVSNIASMLESYQFGQFYPDLAARAVTKYGTSKGWRRNRLRTQSGFTVDALGLDGDVRGIKLEDQRPDMLVLDDLDDSQDGPAAVRSKITALTHDVLPALASNAAILAVQNWIHAEGIFAKLADGTADFLKDRELSGPIKAIEDLVVEQDDVGRYTIKSGTPNWQGQGVADCQNFINTYGYRAFMAECQHEEHNPEGSLYSHVNFRHIQEEGLPPVIRTTVWLDPAITDTDHSDSQAIQVASLCVDWNLYMRRSWEQRSSPQFAMLLALRWAIEYGATTLGVETDQGGDTWISVYREAILQARKEGWLKAGTKAPQFMAAKAGQGHGNKAHRQQQMLPEYENGRIIHVLGPTTAVLERALRRFPLRKPFDLADVCLVAGTGIATENGPVPIEHVQPGERVYTRNGLRTVLQSGQTHPMAPCVRVELDDGRVLQGTAQHPVWTDNRGWVALGELCWPDDIIPAWVHEKSESSMWNGAASGGAVTLIALAETTVSTMLRQMVAGGRYTAPFTSIITAAYRLATMFTTGTAIPRTMPRATWRPCPAPSTNGYMDSNAGSHQPYWSTWLLSAPRLLHGTGAPKAAPGIGSTSKWFGSVLNGAWYAVLSAARSFARATLARSRSVARLAATDIMPSMGTATWQNGNATPAASDTACANTASISQAAVAGRVLRVYETAPAPVYNLSVEDAEEYIANGILVHNCYWTWWALRRGVLRSSGGAAGGQNDVLQSYIRGPRRDNVVVY